ncbi:hypothetical protein [Halorubellus sp. PRR65]|uniref:hypothetical protein n=1 Tax=Halorubellus sp. PRR65 TaxID=3098148 RepID=UPI002B25B71C|nr:hypothetical protein [Halorubellus sp. PRR65]
MTDDSERAAADGTDAAPEALDARVVLADELASIRDLASRASAFVALPEPRVLVEDVRSRPLDERFRTSATAHAERLGVDDLTPAGVRALADDVPVDDPVDRATTFLVRRGGRIQGRFLGQFSRDPESPREHLVLATAAGHLQRAAADLELAAETGDGDLAHHASVVLALAAALFALAEDGLGAPADRDPDDAATDDPLPEWFCREVALADHHRTLARGDDPALDPLDRDGDDLEHLLVVQGATLAVTELDAKPHAVADRADVPLEHLVGVLASE